MARLRAWASCLLAAYMLGLPTIASSQDWPQQGSASPNWINSLRGQVRQNTATLAQELDEFFSDREYESEQNDTRMVLRFHIDFANSEKPRFRVDPQLRLRLPNTQQRIFLDVLGTGPRPNEETGPGGGIVDLTRAEENSGVIQFRGAFDAGGIRISPAIGVDIEAGTPRVYAGVRASASGDLGSGVGIFGSQRVIAYTDGGKEAITLLRGDLQTSDSTLLRLQFLLDWNDDRKGVRYEPAVIYRWVASEKTVLSFENYLQVYSGQGQAADSFLTGLRIRRRLYEDWLFGEFRPWLTFEGADMAARISGAELMIEVNF